MSDRLGLTVLALRRIVLETSDAYGNALLSGYSVQDAEAIREVALARASRAEGIADVSRESPLPRRG